MKVLNLPLLNLSISTFNTNFSFSIYSRKPDGKYHNFRRNFNHINNNLYHYAGNNPVKYTDPDGNYNLPIGYFKKFSKENMSDLAASGGKTHCNDFIPRFLKGLGDKVFNDIMPKLKNPTE